MDDTTPTVPPGHRRSRRRHRTRSGAPVGPSLPDRFAVVDAEPVADRHPWSVPELLVPRPVPELTPPRPVPDLLALPTPPVDRAHVVRDRRIRRRHRTVGSVLAWTGGAAVLLGLLTAGDVAWFYVHSDRAGSALVARERTAIARARADLRATHGSPAAPAPVCAPFTDDSPDPEGLVEAPSIGMEAPVLAGTDDAQLSVAVGHRPGSSWPGEPGTTLLAAHDVTYFSRIGALAPGAGVRFVTPCRTYLYRVLGRQVVAAGAPIYSTPGQSLLVLVTCYPSNALFVTDQRLLVTAELVGATDTGAPVPAGVTVAAPTVPAPPALAAQGLTTATNGIPLGLLDVGGTPAPAWQQSAAPLDDESAALSGYFGALRAAEQDQPSWWDALTEGVPFSAAAPFVGATVADYQDRVDPLVTATGTTLTGVRLDLLLRLEGGADPGVYAVQVTFADLSGSLLITGWHVAPA